MKPLVVIPARGGSKRLPGKNIKPLNGKPLIHYTIDAAREVFEDSIICVSTDDETIKEVSERTGLRVPFIRPAELASDTADSRSVLLHAYEFYRNVKNYQADVIVLLQPTSPLRKSKHIKESLGLYHEDIDMVVSVNKTDSNPYSVLYEENKKGYLEKYKKRDFTRYEDTPIVWELNGAIYVINTKSLHDKNIRDFNKVIPYKMSNFDSVDIDTEMDWYLLEILKTKK